MDFVNKIISAVVENEVVAIVAAAILLGNGLTSKAPGGGPIKRGMSGLIDILSFVQKKDSPGTLKWPLTRSK